MERRNNRKTTYATTVAELLRPGLVVEEPAVEPVTAIFACHTGRSRAGIGKLSQLYEQMDELRVSTIVVNCVCWSLPDSPRPRMFATIMSFVSEYVMRFPSCAEPSGRASASWAMHRSSRVSSSSTLRT